MVHISVILGALLIVLPLSVEAQTTQPEPEPENRSATTDAKTPRPIESTLPVAVPVSNSGQLADAVDSADRAGEEEDMFLKLGLNDLLNVEIVTAGFFPTNIRNTPTYTISSSHSQWQLSTARNIKELLDIYVPGVQMSEHYWSGALIGARGVSVDNNAKTLVLLDGQTMNMRRHFGANSELNLPLIGDLEQVEMVHGPNALVHGGGAINGVVNLVPKSAHDYPGWRMRSEVGFADALVLTEATYGLPYGKENSLLLYAGVVSSRGYEPEELEWNRVDLTARKKAGVTIRTREYAVPSSKLGLYWHHGGFSLQMQAIRIFASTNSAVAPEWFTEEDQYDHGWYRGMVLVRPQLELAFTPDNSLTISLDGQWHDFAMYDKSFQEHDETEGRHGMARGGREQFYSVKAVFRTTAIPLNSLAIGGQVGYRNMDDRKLFFETDPTFGFEDSDIAWWDLSLFAEDIFEFNEHLMFSAGARLDHTVYGTLVVPDMGEALDVENSGFGRVTAKPDIDSTDLSPRLAVVFSIDDDHLLKLSYSRGFRLPDGAYYGHLIKNNYIVDNDLNVDVPGAPDLGDKREELVVEVMDSIEFNSTNSFFDNKLSLDLNIYYNMYHDLLSWKNNSLFVNIPDTFGSVGGELIGRAEPFRSLMFSVSYGYSRPTGFTEESYEELGSMVNADFSGSGKPVLIGDEWICYSGHQIKSHLSWQLIANRLHWHANFRLYSAVDVHDVEDEKGNPIQSSAFGDNVVIINTAVTYNINPYIGIKLTFQNVTANTTPSATTLNAIASSGHNGIDQRLFYLSLSSRI